MAKEERRNAAKKRRREARKRGENVQKRSRTRFTIAPVCHHIVKVCWPCIGTGLTFVQLKKPRFKSCAACGGVGGELQTQLTPSYR